MLKGVLTMKASSLYLHRWASSSPQPLHSTLSRCRPAENGLHTLFVPVAAELLDRCNDPEALLASGRGLLLMRGFSDELFFNPPGNEVTLVLYSESQDRELTLGTNNSVGTERRLVVA